MKRTKTIVRVAAAILALLLLATTVIGGLGMQGFAASSEDPIIADVTIFSIRNENEDEPPTYIAIDETYSFWFEMEFAADKLSGMPLDNFDKNSGIGFSDANWDIYATRSYVYNARYNRETKKFTVGMIIVADYEGPVDATTDMFFNFDFDYRDEDYTVKVALPIETYSFADPIDELPIDPGDGGDGGGGVDEGEENPVITPQIVVENMIALDSAGNRIDEITEDTPPFTLEVVFADVGLQHIPATFLRNGDLDTYITNAGGFILGSSARGTVSMVTQSDYPRFRARFTDITYSGADKSLGFTVFYDLFGLNPDPVKGEGTATLFSAVGEGEGEGEEDDSNAGIKVPKIIISSYSYGEEAIFAGDEFPLDFTVTNTSAELALENIVITLTPAAPAGATKGPGLIVGSSSNTIYLPALGPGASQSNSVSFKARPDAEVTSHLIDVRFSYEYQKSEKEGYVAAPELTESIAIPVSQIDRFTVDPVQDAPYGQVGEELYLAVNFINKGKSPTYNVSGTVKIDESVSAPPQHFGNLEAGASNSLDFYLTGSMPGVFEGEVVMQYEDDNGAVKEIATPFTMTVEEPWVPPMDMPMDPGMLEPPPPAGPNVWTIVLCAAGGLAIAVPLALYLMKRVKAKGSEDFDESV